MPTRTAEQRRDHERQAFDAYMAQCPSRKLLDRVSDKWVTLTLCSLDANGSMRYSELSRHLAGVSQKMLTQTLRALQRDGLIAREVTPTVPVRVDYSLTPLGQSLIEPIRGMKQWAESHMADVEAARQSHDDLPSQG